MGTTIGCDFRGKSRLTFIMFADDTTIIAKSKQALRKMLADLTEELSKLGLSMNAKKCSIQCSKARPHGDAVLKAGGLEFPIVSRDEGFKILGTMFTLKGAMDLELQRRQDAAWGKFHELNRLLLKRDSSITKRLQLFETTVSKTLLWGAESWVLTAKQKRQLRSTQRTMLRRIVDTRRSIDEDWVDWVKRATRVAETHAAAAKVESWVDSHLRLKWNWAGKIMNMSPERWARRVTVWRDSEWSPWQLTGASAYGTRPIRSRAGHFQRWENELCQYAASIGEQSWQSIALDKSLWDSHTASCIRFIWKPNRVDE